MSRVIVFCGLSGTGKTTLATEIARRLNTVCMSKDVLKESLYDLYGGASLEDSKVHGRKSIELLITLAEKNIQNSVDIVLESPFNHPDNPKLFQEWLEKFGIDLRVIILSVSEEERLRRMLTRARHTSHHDEQRYQEGELQQQSFDYSVMPGRKLWLDTTETQEVLIDKALEFLKEV